MGERHLLVTNDFPPKLGGIQSYLWELWRRLPPERTAVLTTPHDGADRFDAAQAFHVERTSERVLLPTPGLRRRIDDMARRVDASVIVLDPALPLGLLGPSLERPYAVVLHGAEITVPGRLPGTRRAMARVLDGARHVISAGGYPLAEAERALGRPLAHTLVPPGVDPQRFRPLDEAQRRAARARLGIPAGDTVVLSLSRLVPRKGMDVVIRASDRLADTVAGLRVVIGGTGRDLGRLERLAAGTRAPVTFLGRVPDQDLPDLYGCCDLFAMLCRNRWGGLEQEGFGIVFLEAAAAGVAAVAGRSGGAHEAVAAGLTGAVVDRPDDDAAVARAMAPLLVDEALRRRTGMAGRRRVEEQFDYDLLAARLDDALTELARRAS